jgi:hypothetical protein
MPAQKSAKTVFFEENNKGSSPKWGDQDDEEIQNAPLWNYGATNEENASSSATMSAEKRKNGSPSGKEEKDPSAEESQPLSEAGQRLVSMMKPDTAEKFKAFLKDKLQERQHSLSDSNSSGCVNPPASPRETSEDKVMQVDSQGNSLDIPPHVAAQIDAIQEEEVDPESLLLPEMYSRYVRGELNSVEDVRNTYEALMGQSFGISETFVYERYQSQAHA